MKKELKNHKDIFEIKIIIICKTKKIALFIYLVYFKQRIRLKLQKAKAPIIQIKQKL